LAIFFTPQKRCANVGKKSNHPNICYNISSLFFQIKINDLLFSILNLSDFILMLL
jgi:hypothetical protein